jgi:iron complex outermembrane receptor protein
MKITPSERLLSVIVLTILVAAFSGFSFAQEEPEEEPVVQAKPVVVGEIVVTAEKREENVQDVPFAISTLAGEDLHAITTGGPDVRGLSARVPSLVLESSFGRAFPRFYIRGLGNPDFDLNASQPVSMVVDEVVLENPVVKGMPLWDLDRVEVLRGPQGTLFGRNTPAGIVKFETKKPTDEFDAYVRLSYGTFGTIDFNGAVGGPMSDTVLYRFSGLYQTRDDWVDNAHTGENDALGGYDTTAYRMQFLWEPSDSFSALLNLHGWEVDGTARIFRANIIQAGDDELAPGFEQDTVYQDGLNQQEIDAFGAVLRLEYNFDSATLTSVTGFETLDMYSRGDIDGGFGAVFLGEGNYGPGFIPFASESADGIPNIDQLTQEIRIASNNDGPFNWLAGAFLFKEELQVDSFGYDSLAPGNPPDGYAYQKQEADAYALFGSVDYDASEKWMLKAGLRFSHDEKDFIAQRVTPPFVQTLFLGVQPSVVIPAQVEDDFMSWNVSATYKASPDLNIYGRIATGFRAPSIQGRILWCGDVDGTNPSTNCVTIADTEDILSFEAGIKSILLNHKLRFNLTGYMYEVNDQQVTAVGGATNTARLLNVDKTKGFGFELDTEYIPSGNWLMTFGLSYNPTEIDDESLTVAACGGGCTVTDPTTPDGGLAYVDGNSLPHAPEWVANGIINFRSDPAGKAFFGTLDFAYYSDKSFFMYESEEFEDDSFEVGLRAGYAWNQADYEIALFARNLFDEEIVRGGIDFNNLTGFTNDPRIIGIEFVAHF